VAVLKFEIRVNVDINSWNKILLPWSG